VTLYHFYQQDYFDALTELMVAQELEQLGAHADGAELLRGGISLSYGMDLEAEQIFTQLLSDTGQADVRDRAWYYMAKVAWQRGDIERTTQALQQLGTMDNSHMGEEVNYLRSALALRQGDIAGAQGYTAKLPEQSLWLPYHYYNLGALQASDGHWLQAANSFRRVDNPWVDSEELKSLRDRAYTASGFALMATGDYGQASSDFTRVRLESPLADRALLGYGWAAVERENYQIALSAWHTLGEKPAISTPARESLLAVPIVYEKIGREGAALASYQAAARVFEAELDSVRVAQEVFTQGDMLSLLNLKAETIDEWLFGGDILPVNAQAPYLRQLIAGHEFQAAMKELRDLHRVDLRLSDAARRLEVLTYVDADQQVAWASVIEGDREEELKLRMHALQEKFDKSQHRLARAGEEADGRALADTAQLELWERLERATRISETMDTSPEQQQQLALYRGLLIWDDSENYAPALWRGTRQLRELEQLLQQSREGVAAIDRAVEQQIGTNSLSRIEGMSARVEAQRVRVDVAMLASDEELRRVAVAELQEQSLELTRALGQSKLAIARLYDQGSTGGRQ
jgi:tetratricopeptide (TPR) repeat protein